MANVKDGHQKEGLVLTMISECLVAAITMFVIVFATGRTCYKAGYKNGAGDALDAFATNNEETP